MHATSATPAQLVFALDINFTHYLQVAECTKVYSGPWELRSKALAGFACCADDSALAVRHKVVSIDDGMYMDR